ncbi:hypothetical protein PC39_09705 [Salinisphaera sp. PC39]|uniref:acetyltransferase n=1 Tax=Salinisphaera sp. PC39 TaxID=1304156 RepID=UPI00333FF828
MSGTSDRELELAERVRAACIEAAVAGYRDAAIRGLCGEGALEAAISAIRGLELARLVDDPAD